MKGTADMTNQGDFDDEIDYLHPDGKPQKTADEQVAAVAEDSKPELKHFTKALEEADGHSIKRMESQEFLHGSPEKESPEVENETQQ
jgi:hypothetical protein